MTAIHIICTKFADESGAICIGGIESYIQLLGSTLSKKHNIHIHQPTACPQPLNLQNFQLHYHKNATLSTIIKTLERDYLIDNDVLIFSTDQYCRRTNWPISIVIQHGISWDIPTHMITNSRIARFFERTYRMFTTLRNHRRISHFNNIACVDYNYYNWYHTLATKNDRKKSFFIIPNCSGPHFSSITCGTSTKAQTICFARRFVAIRGIALFIQVATTLLSLYPNIRILITGDGTPDETALAHNFAASSNRVEHLQSSYNDMPAIYNKCDIVVIPSIASEGTSFSALEAMSMGKCVVATAVGGLTNIIINNYNGILCQPNYSSLLDAIRGLIDDHDKFNYIRNNAHTIANKELNYKNWSTSWEHVIDQIQHTRPTT